MHHKLDIHPIPEEVLYVNDLLLAGKVPYETKDDMEKAVTGKKKSEGGILPDDNVRIYVPMDLNAEDIMWRLYALYGREGIDLAGKIVKYLEENEGTAECFPYDEVEKLREMFWL